MRTGGAAARSWLGFAKWGGTIVFICTVASNATVRRGRPGAHANTVPSPPGPLLVVVAFLCFGPPFDYVLLCLHALAHMVRLFLRAG